MVQVFDIRDDVVHITVRVVLFGQEHDLTVALDDLDIANGVYKGSLEMKRVTE